MEYLWLPDALLGEMGLDPAQMTAAANLITASELIDERELILGFIDEYQDATRKSHYINTFIGGVGYVASFAGPLGKGLSYVATVGGTMYPVPSAPSMKPGATP
ncbi:MAG: hypothetical protein ACOX18_06740 [Bacillota bacterium]